MNNWQAEHQKRVEENAKKIDLIYQKAAQEAGQIGATVSNFDPNKIFNFADYPQTKYRIDKMVSMMTSQIQATIVNGVTAEWKESNFKNDQLAQDILGYKKQPDQVGAQLDMFAQLTAKENKAIADKYFNNHQDALQAFIQRKDSGLGLSQRVWNITQQFKQELELGLDNGIRNGHSAAQMSRDLKQYLNEPDRVYKRFHQYLKDDQGNPVLNKSGNKIPITQLRRRYIDPATGKETWKVETPPYKPGRGIYRSSRANAMRLSRTENNMAYKTADHHRIQDLDFVVGIKIGLSGSHKIIDICDELKGDYPKDFKFGGWHPQCMCPVTFILKTKDELKSDTQKILDGQETDCESQNLVKEAPPQFHKWTVANTDRIANGQSIPYFVRDNFKAGDITQGLKPSTALDKTKAAAAQAAAKKAAEQLAIQYAAEQAAAAAKQAAEDLANQEAAKLAAEQAAKQELIDKATAKGLKKLQEAELAGVDGKAFDGLKASLDATNPNPKTIQYKIDQMNIVLKQKKDAIKANIAKMEALKKEAEAAKLLAEQQAAAAAAKAIKDAEEAALKAKQAIQAKEAIATGKKEYYVELGQKKLANAKKWGVSGKEYDDLEAIIADDKATYSQIKGKIDKLNPVVDKAKANTVPINAGKTISSPAPAASAPTYTQAELDQLHQAHQAFLDKISNMSLEVQLKKLDYEIGHVTQFPKYKTSPEMLKLLQGDLADLKMKTWVNKAGETVLFDPIHEAKVAYMAEWNHPDPKVQAIAKKLKTLSTIQNPSSIQVKQTIQELNNAVSNSAPKYKKVVAAANAGKPIPPPPPPPKPTVPPGTTTKPWNMTRDEWIAAREVRRPDIDWAKKDIEFFNDTSNKYDMSKHYTAEERKKVNDLRKEIANEIAKNNGNIRDNGIMDLEDELKSILDELSHKYVTKQKSLQHFRMVNTSGTHFVAENISDKEAEAAYLRYINHRKVGEKIYSNGGPIGGVFEDDAWDKQAKAVRYIERIKSEGVNVENEVSVVQRYFRGQSFINKYLLGVDRPGGNITKEIAAVLDDYTGALSHSLNKLPRYNGYTYRGWDFIDGEVLDDLLEAANTGKEWTHKLVCSTSTASNKADNFGTGVTFKIYGRSGVYGDDFTHYTREKEVLYRAGTKFKVLEIYKSNTPGIAERNNITVILEEILE